MIEYFFMIGGAIFAFLFLVLVGWMIGGYNYLVGSNQDLKTQWSNLKTEYQRRSDLFYNLAETVKSYKEFEKETLVEVTKMRNQNFAGSKSEDMKTMKKMDSLFGKISTGLNIVFEKYPDLKSDEHHSKLMDEVRITEDRINIARTSYNSIVRDYNVYVKRFPSNIVATMFNYRVEEFFKNDEESEKPIRINLK